MLSELRLLLGACPKSPDLESYRDLVVEANALLKKTLATRRESFRRLRELYALRPDVILFRALHTLWESNRNAQPLLALLCAAARDPILRATAEVILGTPKGESVTPQDIEANAKRSFPGRYNKTMLANIGRHAASSWQKSGHLSGRLHKVRDRPQCYAEDTAYALFLGHLCGARGEGLFDTLWCRLLDAPLHTLRDHAFAASQQGWLEYRHSGMVTEISFRRLLPSEG